MLNRVRELVLRARRPEPDTLTVEPRLLSGKCCATYADRPIELRFAKRCLRLYPDYRMDTEAHPSGHWILVDGDHDYGESRGFMRLEPGQRLMLGRSNEVCQELFALPPQVRKRQLDIKNEGGLITLTKLDGEGDTFVHYLDDPEEISRPLSQRLANIKQLRRIFGGPISLDPPEQALVTIQKVNSILRQEPYRPKDSGNYPGGLIDLPDWLSPIIIGDLHARVDNLLKILSEGDFLSALSRGQACLVFLGDVIHPEGDGDLEQMDTSLLILDLIFRLKIAFPGNVFYLRGNHESFDEHVGKAGVPQGVLFQRRARQLRGRSYETALAEFFDLLPYVVRSHDVIACHGGPLRRERTRRDLIEIRKHPDLAHELMWTRIRRPTHVSGYTERHVRAFKRTLGVSAETPLIVSHTPLSTDETLWMKAGGVPDHHILYSARADKLAVFARVDGRMLPFAYPAEPLLDFVNKLCVDERPARALEA